jgi:hypothetical protein
MALPSGMPTPLYGFAGPGSQVRGRRYLEAVQRGYLGDYGLLTGFFEEALESSRFRR